MASPTTWSEFKVDLGQLHHAIGVIRREHDQIDDALSRIASEFDKCRDDWNTPAAVTFDDVRTWLTDASADLNALLSDMVTRMQTAYNNYKHVEEVNTQNLKHKRSGSHDGDHEKRLEGVRARTSGPPLEGVRAPIVGPPLEGVRAPIVGPPLEGVRAPIVGPLIDGRGE